MLIEYTAMNGDIEFIEALKVDRVLSNNSQTNIVMVSGGLWIPCKESVKEIARRVNVGKQFDPRYMLQAITEKEKGPISQDSGDLGFIPGLMFGAVIASS